MNFQTSGKKHGLDKTPTALREIAVETNKEAAIFSIPQSSYHLCQTKWDSIAVMDRSRCIHRHSSYYIRTVKGYQDPLLTS